MQEQEEGIAEIDDILTGEKETRSASWPAPFNLMFVLFLSNASDSEEMLISHELWCKVDVLIQL
jgi:hypothetical protein